MDAQSIEMTWAQRMPKSTDLVNEKTSIQQTTYWGLYWASCNGQPGESSLVEEAVAMA